MRTRSLLNKRACVCVCVWHTRAHTPTHTHTPIYPIHNVPNAIFTDLAVQGRSGSCNSRKWCFIFRSTNFPTPVKTRLDLSIHLCVYLSMYLSIYVCIYPSIYSSCWSHIAHKNTTHTSVCTRGRCSACICIDAHPHKHIHTGSAFLRSHYYFLFPLQGVLYPNDHLLIHSLNI